MAEIKASGDTSPQVITPENSLPRAIDPSSSSNSIDQEGNKQAREGDTDTTQPIETLAAGNNPTVAPSGLATTTKPSDVITWTASEFIAHPKSAGWYGLLALAAIVLTSITFLLTKEIFSASVVVAGSILFGIVAARQPREVEYRLDSSGFKIGQKYYGFADFRSFSVVQEGAFASIIFMPLKRFAPLTAIYFAPEDESRIVALLNAKLPSEDYRHDTIERLMRRIRF